MELNVLKCIEGLNIQWSLIQVVYMKELFKMLILDLYCVFDIFVFDIIELIFFDFCVYI